MYFSEEFFSAHFQNRFLIYYCKISIKFFQNYLPRRIFSHFSKIFLSNINKNIHHFNNIISEKFSKVSIFIQFWPKSKSALVVVFLQDLTFKFMETFLRCIGKSDWVKVRIIGGDGKVINETWTCEKKVSDFCDRLSAL